MKVRLFFPAYNVAEPISMLIRELDDVEGVLEANDHELAVLFIDDHSSDSTGDVLADASASRPWLSVTRNEENKGNAANIRTGYAWGVESDADIVGCMDADGEHSPYALIRHLRMIESGACDGIAGSIIFPDHDMNYHDRNMMRFWGGMQSAMAGVDGMFYIQSPGYNLHKRGHAAQALALLDRYEEFFAKHSSEPFPRWGLHGVIIHLIAAGAGARVKAAYLECFGHSPNRTPEKLLLQANAANTHATMLKRFLSEK